MSAIDTPSPPAAQAVRPPSTTFDMDEILSLFIQKRYDDVSQKLITVLDHFRVNTMVAVSSQEQYFLDQFVKVLLFVLSEPKFVVSERFVRPFFSLNHVISNIVAISSTRTTDAHVQIVIRQSENIIRLLTLYSARNRFKIDRKVIFDVNPKLASIWYSYYACSYYGALSSQVGWENLREHFLFSDARLRIPFQIQETYFGSTYAGSDCDRKIKPVVNQTVREATASITIRRRTPDPRKIVVLSGFWTTATSVYRIFSSQLRSLKPDFHLTFVQFGEAPPAEPNLWDEVRKIVPLKTGGLNLDPLQDNDWQIAHFPDIGMSDSSVILSNMRIAPIQTMAPGHPNSTFGGQIDYFMSGEELEPPVNPEQNYSERLVMMPGMGLVHTKPKYQPHGQKKQNSVCVINIPAWCQKINYPYVQTLVKILRQARSKVKFRLFSGSSLSRCNDYIPFCLELSAALGQENLEVVPNLPYERYMAETEMGDLALDAYHFGGGNTVSDNLFTRVPIICWEGDQWYNRIGPGALRRAQLPELIATNEQEFIDLAVKMIDDTSYRESVIEKLKRLDLDHLLYDPGEGSYFNKAIHYLIDNHERLQAESSREPIRISR